MRRQIVILLLVLLAGGAAFFGGRKVAAYWCDHGIARSTDDLEWLRLEFGVKGDEMRRIRELHEGYLPRCREFCARIDERKRNLMAALSSPTNSAVMVEQELMEIGKIRAQCQAAMIEHFRQVSREMPPGQGERYLAEMQRLTLGFHEQIESTMTHSSPEHHGHQH